MISRYENGRSSGEPPSPGGWRRYGTLQSCVAGLFDENRRWRANLPMAGTGKVTNDGKKNMGMSENSVPLNPMVNDHYPY